MAHNSDGAGWRPRIYNVLVCVSLIVCAVLIYSPVVFHLCIIFSVFVC